MIKIYIESRDGKRYELSINEFIKKTKLFVEGHLAKPEILDLLKNIFQEIYDKAKHTGSELNTMIIEAQPRGFEYRYSDTGTDYAMLDLLQQFITFFSTNLNDILCQKALNKKWIKSTGNPVYSDINLYGFLKEDNAIIIKSFLFATLPTEKELYISSTCGTGGTSVIFEALKGKIENKGFEEAQYNKVQYIHLESIENANTIKFYTKLQFYKTNKDTHKILKYMVKQIYKKKYVDFDDFVRKAGQEIGGSLYWAPKESILKKLKAEYIYQPELWFKNIQKFKQDGLSKQDVLEHFYSKYEELEGAGIPNIM